MSNIDEPSDAGEGSSRQRVFDPDLGNQPWSTPARHGPSPLSWQGRFGGASEDLSLNPHAPRRTHVVDFVPSPGIGPKCPSRLRCPRPLLRTRCKSWACEVCGPIRAHDEVARQVAALAAWADWTPPASPQVPGRLPVPGRLITYRVRPKNQSPADLWAAVTRLQGATRENLLSITAFEGWPLHLHAVGGVRDRDQAELKELLAHAFALRPADLDEDRLWVSDLPGVRYQYQTPLEAAQWLLRYQGKYFSYPVMMQSHLDLNRGKPSHPHPDLRNIAGGLPPRCPACGDAPRKQR